MRTIALWLLSTPVAVAFEISLMQFLMFDFVVEALRRFFVFFFSSCFALFSVRIAFKIPWKLCHLSHNPHENGEKSNTIAQILPIQF